MNPIIFLDIDGVLNNDRYDRSRERQIEVLAKNSAYTKMVQSPGNMQAQREYKTACGLMDIDPRNVKALNQLVEELDCRVVISSTWRKHYSTMEIANLLSQKGLERPSRVISSTGVLYDRMDYRPVRARRNRCQRGLEIERWLLTELPREEMLRTPFVILDDSTDFGRLRQVHIRTYPRMGGFHDNPRRKATLLLRRQIERQKPAGATLAKPHWLWYQEQGMELYPDREWGPDKPIPPCETCRSTDRQHKFSCQNRS